MTTIFRQLCFEIQYTSAQRTGIIGILFIIFISLGSGIFYYDIYGSSTLTPTDSTLPTSSSPVSSSSSTFQDVLPKTSRNLSPTDSTLSTSSSAVTTSSATSMPLESINPAPTTTLVHGTDHAFTPILGTSTIDNPPPTTSTVVGTDKPFIPTLGTTISDNPPPTFTTVDGFPPPVVVVGGELIPLDTTMVLLAGTQMTASWMIPAIVSVIGIGIVVARKF